MNTYEMKAQATKSRRSYRKPTPAQRAAYRKLVQRGGEANLTQADALALSTHPCLAASQKAHFAALSVNW